MYVDQGHHYQYFNSTTPSVYCPAFFLLLFVESTQSYNVVVATVEWLPVLPKVLPLLQLLLSWPRLMPVLPVLLLLQWPGLIARIYDRIQER